MFTIVELVATSAPWADCKVGQEGEKEYMGYYH